MVRVGFGYDVHRLIEGRKLWLGGVLVPYDKGLLGHSDADVAIHALCDALLGAAALRDIGYWFPDTSGDFKDIDSKILLRKVVSLLSERGYRINNVDVTICAQSPKLSPYIDEMRAVLAEVMNLDIDRVSVKATTTERLGFVGEGLGMAAQAVACIEKQ